MLTLNLKPTQKVIASYYDELQQLSLLAHQKEGAVSPAFAGLLRHCAKQYHWTLVEQYALSRGTTALRIDGALVDNFNLVYGYWEAKDIADDLAQEVKKKFAVGYPQENILFQAPNRAILWQGGQQVCDQDISKPDALVDVLKAFFEYQPPAYEEWQRAVEEFKLKVPELAQGLLQIIEQERQTNKTFVQAFEAFMTTCREAINPNLSPNAVEEMLIQHLLTERIFSKVFDNPYFLDHNAVARDIKKVVLALTSKHFSPQDFLKQLNRFYVSIESTAAYITDFSQKQAFLNTVYEKFFQGYAIKVADTHGIVYTPQPVVRFMVNSIEEILQTEFGRSLSDKDVHILDPFVGTGNFLLHVMRRIKKTALPRKYAHDLHCNEVMLLPYYVASMNIEHEYYALTGAYQPFDGICLVDTFELAEDRQLPLFTEENTARVVSQKKTPLFVILGNPPYNAGQVNENDNNKNRKYKTMDKRVADTYAKDSAATNKNALSDPYIKALRWASDRIGEEGMVAFITNSKFLHGIATDGVRKHLAQDFTSLYCLDLGGNVKENPKLSGTTHNVFGIQVGVSISLLIKKRPDRSSATCQVWYAHLDEYWRKEQKYAWLDEKRSYQQVEWQAIIPDVKHTWLTEGLQDDFDTFLPMGTKEGKTAHDGKSETIFKTYSIGAGTARDDWAYNFNRMSLADNMKRMIEMYNYEVYRWQMRSNQQANIDDFVMNDSAKIKWSSRLKECLMRGQKAEFAQEKIRRSLYRPFSEQWLFFDEIMTHRQGQIPHIFPTPATETENRVICMTDKGSEKPFMILLSHHIPDMHLVGAGSSTQCFPFYTYDKDGSNRRENITDWALAQFRAQYDVRATGRSPQQNITKWDIFYYIYALLHHPHYREKYAANLKRELPRIPLIRTGVSKLALTTKASFGTPAEVFWALTDAGRKLAELHVNYEQQPEYPLQMIETPDRPLNWRVDKMKLSKDKTQIMYNDFLTLAGIPAEAFEYRLGNRSALDWIIDQYQVATDPRSGLKNDPNRADDPEYIVRLMKQVVTVSVETVKIVKELPELERQEGR